MPSLEKILEHGMTACQVKYSLTPNHAQTNLKVKVGLKNLALLPNYFDFIFVHLRQKARLRPELSRKFLSSFGPNATRKARPDLQL